MAGAYTIETVLTVGIDVSGNGGTVVPVLPGAQVTEDQGWVPSISAQVTVPAEYAVDARTAPLARLEMYRTAPGGGSGTAGLWRRLVVRRCVTDHMAGTAALTLESADILLLGTAVQPGGAGLFTDLASAINQVFNVLDPGARQLADSVIQPDVTNASTPLVDIVGEGRLPRWDPPASAVDYLTAVGDAYRCRFRMDRDGLLVAYRTWNRQWLTLDESQLLEVQHGTDAAAFNNYAVVFDSDTSTILAERRTADPALGPAAAGRRVNFHRAPTVDAARMDRAMSQGETWQFTAVADYSLTAGDRLTIDAPNLGIALSQDITSVVHTSDGTMTIDIQPPVIGEAVP